MRRLIAPILLSLLALTGGWLLVTRLALASPAAVERVQPSTTIVGTLRIQPVTVITAGTQVLTPTSSVYLLAPTATATITLVTSTAKAGDFLTLVGSVTTETIIVDTGATATGGNRTLTDTDVLDLIFNGSVWAEKSFINNQ
ncbi:MAG: hypothetical protein KJ077_10390 [Anaerolineae bacterium]|nr:hypothetical protein [Anaerolineae bacterium]